MKKSKTWTWLSCDHPLSLLQVSLNLGLSQLTLCANVAQWNLLTFYLCVYMYEIAEENSQHLKVTRKIKNNTTHINGVITLWVSLTKYQTITFIMTSWSAAMTPHWLYQLPMVGTDKYQKNLPKISCKPLYKHLHPEFSIYFGCNRKTQSWCWLVIQRHV